MDESKTRWWVLISTTLVVLLIDQISKRVVVENMLLGESVTVIDPVFRITRSFNTGAAFGFLPEAGDLFLVIAIIVIIGLFFYYPRLPADARITRLATGMVCGGALGNAFDRIQYEHVVDFIHYRIPGMISNVSNLADHAIVFGVILIMIDSWLQERREAQAAAAQAHADDAAATDADDSSSEQESLVS